MSFDEWAFLQCVTQGHEINSIKNSNGENTDWINTTTGEKFSEV